MGVQIVLIFHVLVAISLIALVLLQQGKGAAMGAAFGSGASGTVFGSRGSRGFLYKLTGGLAIAFFATSIILTYLAAHNVADAQAEDNIPGLTEPVKQVHTTAPQAPIKPSV